MDVVALRALGFTVAEIADDLGHHSATTGHIRIVEVRLYDFATGDPDRPCTTQPRCSAAFLSTEFLDFE
jgi:hypothetical protein